MIAAPAFGFDALEDELDELGADSLGLAELVGTFRKAFRSSASNRKPKSNGQRFLEAHQATFQIKNLSITCDGAANSKSNSSNSGDDCKASSLKHAHAMLS